MTERTLPRLAGSLAWGLLALAALTQLIRITVRDTLPGLSVLFYALPVPILAGLILVAGVLWFAGRSQLRALLCLAAATGLMGVWLADNYRPPPAEGARGELRVLFWNVGRGRGGWERIGEEIRSADADVIGLVETSYHYPDPHTYWSRQFPGYSVFVAGSGMTLISKAEIDNGALHVLGQRSRCATAEIAVDDRLVRVVLVDLEANPFLARAPLIERVEELASRFPETPTLILGDFNTPGESAGFDRLRNSHVNVFEEVGTGLLPTWPSVLPVLALDQVWVSSHFIPVAAAKSSSLISDHSRLWCDLRWRKGLLHPLLGLYWTPVDRPLPRCGPASPPGWPVIG